MSHTILKILALSRLFFIDGVRRHAILGLVVLALCFEIIGILFVDFIPRDIGRASADFIISIGWLAGFLFLLFHAVQVLAWDDEKRIIHTIISRPISRSQYVLGVFLGLSLILVLLNVILGIIGYAILILIQKSVANQYFSFFSVMTYFLSWLGLFCIEVIVLSIIILFSSVVRGSFPVLLITLSYYLICNGLPVLRESYVDKFQDTPILKSCLIALTTIFPDFNRFDFKSIITVQANNEALYQLPVSVALMFLYIGVSLSAAAIIYQKRDLR